MFRSPPFTEELVSAISLIAPQFRYGVNEASRRHWEDDQNGSCWAEFRALEDTLSSVPAPARVLELGPGLGRSVVFFSKQLGWFNSHFTLYEGNGTQAKYCTLGPRASDSFCGNLELLRACLTYNDLTNFEIVDARSQELKDVQGTFNFLYSFYAVGFHWSLEYFIDDVMALLAPDGIAVFTVPSSFRAFPKLQAISHEILDWYPVWPKNIKKGLVVIKNKV